ncbi:MAG: hypothetical protein CVU39_21995 [Chloroflexi bacterium HGW-Chloroflexi-10]|nr:MAG: hypothetical protein CVU39_21995 [Chloroflexi bacterium HGW-Chloroflexi-10]
MEETKLAGSFVKNSREKIFVGLNEFKGKWRIFIRAYVPSVEEGKDWLPTQKGISLEVEQYPALLSAMEETGKDLQTEREVAAIGKSKTQEIRVGISHFKNMQLVDLRTYVEIDGEKRPTQKGVSMKAELYPQLMEAVRKLGELIHAAS